MLRTLYRDLRWGLAYALNDLSGTPAEYALWLELRGLQPEANIIIEDISEPLFAASRAVYPEV